MRYLKIETENVCNGSGLRVVLWLSGCDHKCKNCQNPQTWNADYGIPFDEVAKQEIFTELSKDYISGITFSGGDPLYKNNVIGVLSLIREIKEKFPQKTIWLYTGYTYEEIIQPINLDKLDCSTYKYVLIRRHILKKCDVLVDGEYIDKLRNITLQWRGSSNQRVIDIQKTIIKNRVVLYCD